MLEPTPIPTALDYNSGKGILPDGAFRIGASSFSMFMDRPWQWYREKVLNESGFIGNTSSVIGTICHYCAQCKAEGTEPILQEIENYIKNHSYSRIYPDVDTQIVRDSWKQMAMTLVNEYVLPNKSNLEEVEPFVYKELQPGYFPSGSIDRVEKVGNGTYTYKYFKKDGALKKTKIEISKEEYDQLQDTGIEISKEFTGTGTMRIVDYKTYNSKTKPTSIPMYYKYQLLIYAYIYSKPVSEIRLVYINRAIDGTYISEKTGKACGKIHPPEVTILTEPITPDDLAFIESVLHLCIDTHRTSIENPYLTYLLYRDYRLKDL